MRELTERVVKFTCERDWDQFYFPENLAKSISIEAGELLDLYELISQEELDNISSIIGKDEIGENDSEVFDIINQVSVFIRTTSNMNLRNYINHPRNYFTKNIVTLSLDNEL